MAAEDRNSVAGRGPGRIVLMVNSQDGENIGFRMRRSTPLERLMTNFCDRRSLDIRTVAFVYNGMFLRPENTPAEMQMQDGDVIDALLHQIGGAPAA